MAILSLDNVDWQKFYIPLHSSTFDKVSGNNQLVQGNGENSAGETVESILAEVVNFLNLRKFGTMNDYSMNASTKKNYKNVKRTRGFITDVSRALGLTQHEASKYGSFTSHRRRV